MVKKYCIYKITNKVNGKTYVGQHKYKKLNDNYMGSGKLLKLAKKKYGIENFTKTILEFDIPNVDLANDWEQMYILFERAKGKAEYNIANGGQGGALYKGKHHSEETKRKMSEARKGRKLGPCSEEHRKHLSEVNTGKRLSEETKRKISESSKGKKRGPLSEEHRKHLSESLKGMHWYTNGKITVLAFDCPNGFRRGK